MTDRRTPRGLATAVVSLALLAAATATACGSEGTGAGKATVTVKTFEFRPDPITIDAGDTVTFVNDDAIDHTVTAGTRDAPEPDMFDGKLPEKGARFELTLAEPGTYDYFCTIHPGPGMTGIVEVR